MGTQDGNETVVETRTMLIEKFKPEIISMGDDGAKGMFTLRQAGAYTIAQSKETSVIFGMPKRAIEIEPKKIVRTGVDVFLDTSTPALIPLNFFY
ncbi:chemotaxis protein CheB [Phosphitispora fastidiosa]|uniref:chemotaxis protein CheB n=1 Tax=Phosphitispora fastidiosa TaxID=2837202 RepID=UPI001E5C2374|nr:chemotaxis protein CheB [Phosphitispora fastidiosa]MBU7007963.1 hypothetical protein [Phosphitispora fastidiosa]